MRAVATVVAWVALTLAAAASPTPPPRPSDLDGTPPPKPAVPEPPPGPAPASAASCLDRLRAAGHLAEPAPLPGPQQDLCKVEEPLRLSAVAVSGAEERRVKLPDTPLIACALAETLAAWIGRVAAPILEPRTGSTLAAIRTGPGYECRSRNRQPGAKLSAHARGRAVDVAAFEFANGRSLAVATMAPAGLAPDRAPEPGGTLQALRISACGWFTTVLGPGSDGFHADHLHLDVEPHGTSDNYRICR